MSTLQRRARLSVTARVSLLRISPIGRLKGKTIFVERSNPYEENYNAQSCFALLFSCKKDKNGTYTVKFVTSGDNVTQFKVYQGSTVADKAVPFSGTRDTTIMVTSTTVVKLDSKANSNNLTGTIFVNGDKVATGTDTDADGDGKSQVKLEYTLTN